jgi:hypothetical protein
MASLKSGSTSGGTAIVVTGDSRLTNSRACNNSFDSSSTARTNLGLGSIATLSTITSSNITDGTIVSADISSSINGYGTRTVSTSAATGGSDGDVWYKY